MLTRRSFFNLVGAGAAGLTLAWPSASRGNSNNANNRPNFIFYITDDISVDDLGPYGNPFVKTPHLDRMAEEGIVFDNAYLTTAQCSPMRCSTITGRYPHNTGAPELHNPLPDDQYVFTDTLRQVGYYTALSGKTHMGPNIDRAFDDVFPSIGHGGQEEWVSIMRNRPKDKPFFFWFASHDAHRPWQFDDKAPRYEPDEITVPPYLYDGPETRQDLADYFHEVSRTDYYLGQLRDELERQGIVENTYVIYISDNGRPFPRSKAVLYESSIKTPLIIWAPNRIQPSRTDSLVSSIDFAPTFLELAGINQQANLTSVVDDSGVSMVFTPSRPQIQGVSFAKILSDPTAKTRDYVFAERNWHVHQAHQRMVRYKKWVYMRDAWPERMALEGTLYTPTGQELLEKERQGLLQPHQRNMFLQPRPPEELYNVDHDPHQFNNLADSELPEHQEVLAHLREVLNRWTEQTGDTVPDDPTNDMRDIDGKRNPDFRRGTRPGAERNARQINHPGPILRQ